MPLKQGKSKVAFQSNVEAELASGKPRAQALAIAYSVQRRSGGDMAKKKPDPPMKTEAFGQGGYHNSVETLKDIAVGSDQGKTYPFHQRIADTAKDLTGQAITAVKRAVTGEQDTSATDRAIAEKKRVNSYLRKRPLR